MALLPAIQTQRGRPAAPLAESEESKPHLLSPDAFVLLTDDSKCRLARIENISILEAFQNATFVHLDEDKLLIRRSLVECERRLDNSTFVRASRDWYRQSESGEAATPPQRWKAHFNLKG